jgi:ABC-2 type transport system ATP-binding protein
MPQPGKLRGSARFGPLDSPCRKFFGACSDNNKTKPDRPVIMQSDVSALEVRGLTKRFDRPAVDALDLTVRTGEFYALLGPNGAGKTTTLRMLTTLLMPTAGSATVAGCDLLGDPDGVRRRIGYVAQGGRLVFVGILAGADNDSIESYSASGVLNSRHWCETARGMTWLNWSAMQGAAS